MTTPSWPSSLPAPLRPRLSEEAQSNVLAFQPETGPPIIRRRGTARSLMVTMVLRLSGAELETAIAFFEGDLMDGALRFTMPHPRTGNTEEWVFEAPWSSEPVEGDVGYYHFTMKLRMLP